MIKLTDMLLEHFKAVEKEVIKPSTSKSQKCELKEELLATCSLSQTTQGCSYSTPGVAVSTSIEMFQKRLNSSVN